MAKLRISIVEFLNTAPLVWGFTDGPLTGKYDLSFTLPSQCAEALRRGDVDVAIIPAIEYQRMENVRGLPKVDIGIAWTSAFGIQGHQNRLKSRIGFLKSNHFAASLFL